MKGTTTSKADAQSRNQKLIAALSEHFKRSDVFTLDGTSYTAKELQQMLQDHTDALNAADAAKAKWHPAVAVARSKGVAIAGILPALRTYLINAYGGSSPIVADFAFTPKARTTSIEAQAAGLAKRRAKRAAGAGAKDPSTAADGVQPKAGATS